MMAKNPTRLVAVAGGKGGVGKTVCTANLAMGVAKRSRTLAVDLDLGCGNLNACLGVKLPSRNIEEFLRADVASLSELRLTTPLDSLDLISCSYQGTKWFSLEKDMKERLLRNLRDGNVDFTFIDLGAGITGDILDFFSAADMKILVTNPESLALHNAYIFLKSLVYRTLASEFEKDIFSAATRNKLLELLNSDQELDMTRVVARFRSWSRYSAYIVQGILSDLKVHVILNMVTRAKDEKYAQNLRNLAYKYLHVDLAFLGAVPYDRHVKKSVNRLTPLLLEYQNAAASRAFEEISLRIENALALA